MLDPKDRHLLLDCLRPPEGYQLDYAVGTTYSLDLLALLTAPLAFTFFDWEDADGRPTADPLALLESVRRHADRILLFCQAGETRIPPASQRLTAYLERSVIPVTAPDQTGVFHPKIWLIRYRPSEDDGSGEVRYRFICLTRNLTFDRSWDSVLVMEGLLTGRTMAIRANHPLGDFIAALPGLAVGPISEGHQAIVARLSDEVRRVRFELPPGVEDFAFWPLGIPGARQPPFVAGTGRLLVMAPFLSAGFLHRLVKGDRRATLISRPDQLANLTSGQLGDFEKVYVLDPATEVNDEDSQEVSDPGLAGLHAKLFIEDDGWNAHVYSGSANASEAAFTRNVEFVTQLTGKKSQLGIDALLDEADRKAGFLRLLQPWMGEAVVSTPEEQLRQTLEDELTDLRRQLGRLPFRLMALGAPDGQFLLQLHCDSGMPGVGDVKVLLWPATLRPDRAKGAGAEKGLIAEFGPVGIEALTSFIAFGLSRSVGSVTARSEFVLNIPLSGAPDDRLERILASQLKDKGQVIRLLWLLLQAETSLPSELFANSSGDNIWSPTATAAEGYPIFEHLVRQLAVHPERLRDVRRLIEDLTRSSEGQQLLPDGLLPLWNAVNECLEGSDVSKSAT